MNAEMDHHLSGDEEAGNGRNGYGRKTVLTETGKLELEYEGELQGGDAVARELIRRAAGRVLDAELRGEAGVARAAAVEAGGLAAYGVNRPELFRRAATYVDKVLKGARAGDLQPHQPRLRVPGLGEPGRGERGLGAHPPAGRPGAPRVGRRSQRARRVSAVRPAQPPPASRSGIAGQNHPSAQSR